MTVAGIIRTYRKQNKVSQAELAQTLGCSTPNISHFERGVTLPRPPIAKRLAKITGFDLGMLLALIERERVENKIARLQRILAA